MARAERRLVEERRRHHHQRVEPAARLPDVLDDEIAGEVAVEPVLVLERVVHLAERHRARLRTSSRARPRRGAWSTCRSDRPGSAASARRRTGGAGPSGGRRNRARSRRASRSNRCADISDRPISTPGSARPSSGCGRCSSRARWRASCRRCRRLTCAGIQSMPWFSSTMRSRKLVTFTYQDGIAL